MSVEKYLLRGHIGREPMGSHGLDARLMAARGARNISSILPKWSLWGEWSEGNEEGKRKRVLFYIVRIARSFWGQLSTAMSFISSFDVFDRKTGPTAVLKEIQEECSSSAKER